MNQNKILFEFRYSFHQRTVLIGFTIIALIGLYNSFPSNYKIEEIILFISFIVITILLPVLTFSTKGILKKDEKLYRIMSFSNITLGKTKIELSNKPVVSILQVKKSQKYAFVSSANPDQGESFYTYELFLLNDKHTKRDSIIYLSNKEKADKAKDFLVEKFYLRHEIFSPDFS